MTFIEFFVATASENVGACLTYVPDRVIYIGDNAKLIKKHIANYERVFKARGHHIEFLYKTVAKSNLDNAVELLSQIVETYDDCVFDITGGDELLLLALGIVYARYPQKNIQIHKINLKNNAVYDCDKDGTTIYRQTPTLSIEENVRIYGGDVVYGAIDESKTYRWDLNEEFLRDIDTIWNICKKDVRYWNTQIGCFDAANTIGTLSNNGLTVTVSRAALDHYLSQRKLRYVRAVNIIADLLRSGLLTYYGDDDDTTVTVSFKNEQVKKCLTKAGQALEMKIYTAAMAAADKDGVPIYDDAMNGVVIDWDGETHDERTEALYDTENEIDVLLMHDMIPIFVSCKNGIVTSDELYKLNTVAERFGGTYAKKILAATSIEGLGEAGRYLRQRAKDMNIQILENVQELDDEQLVKKIKNFWTN